MLSTLNVGIPAHQTCDNALWADENKDYVWGVICDGPTIGINPHFASQSVVYFIQGYKYENITSNDAIIALKNFLIGVKVMFQLTNIHLLTTVILFSYHKKNKSLKIRALGDGYFYVNGKYNNSLGVTENFLPSLDERAMIGYQIDLSEKNFSIYLNNHPEIVHMGAERFVISNISPYRDMDNSKVVEGCGVHPEILTDSIVSKNQLKKYWSTLRHNNFVNKKDLSVISYSSL